MKSSKRANREYPGRAGRRSWGPGKSCWVWGLVSRAFNLTLTAHRFATFANDPASCRRWHPDVGLQLYFLLGTKEVLLLEFSINSSLSLRRGGHCCVSGPHAYDEREAPQAPPLPPPAHRPTPARGGSPSRPGDTKGAQD